MSSVDPEVGSDATLRAFFTNHTLQDVVNSGCCPPVVLDAETPLSAALEALRTSRGPCVLVQNAHTNRLVGALDWSDAIHYSIAALDAAAATAKKPGSPRSAASSSPQLNPTASPTPSQTLALISDELDLSVPIKHVTDNSGGSSLVCFHAHSSLKDILLHLSSGLRYVCVLTPNLSPPTTGAVSATAATGAISGTASSGGAGTVCATPTTTDLSPPEPITPSIALPPTPTVTPTATGATTPNVEGSVDLSAIAKPALNRRRSAGGSVSSTGDASGGGGGGGAGVPPSVSTPTNTPQAPFSRLVVNSSHSEFSVAAAAAAAASTGAGVVSPTGGVTGPRTSPAKGRSSRATTSTTAADGAPAGVTPKHTENETGRIRGRSFSLTDSAHSQAITAAAAAAAACGGMPVSGPTTTAGPIVPDVGSGSNSSGVGSASAAVNATIAAVVTQSDVLRFIQSKYNTLQSSLDRTLLQMNVTPTTSKPVLDRRNSRSNVLQPADSPPTKFAGLNPNAMTAPTTGSGGGGGAPGSGSKADRRLSASSATIAAVAAAASVAAAVSSVSGATIAKSDSYCSIEIGPPASSVGVVKSATTKPPPTLYDALHALVESQKESLCVTENGKLIQTISTAQLAEVLKFRRLSVFAVPLRTFVTGGAEAVQSAAASAQSAAAAAATIFSPLTPSPAQASPSPLPPLPGSTGATRPQVLTVHPVSGKSWLDSAQPIGTGAGTNSPDTGISVASSLGSTSSGGSQSARGSRTDNLNKYDEQPQPATRSSMIAAGSKVSPSFGPTPHPPPPPPLDRKSSPLVTAIAAPLPVGATSPVPRLPLSSIEQTSSAGSGGLPVLALDENAPAGPLLRFRRRSSGPDTPNPEYRILHRTRDSTIEVPANTKPTASSGSGGSRPNSQPPSPSKARRTSGGAAATSSLIAAAFAGTNTSSGGGAVGVSTGTGGVGSPILMPVTVGVTTMAGAVNPPNTSGNNNGTGSSGQPLPFNAGPVPGLITVPVAAVPETVSALAGDKLCALSVLSGKHGRSGGGGSGVGTDVPAWSYSNTDRDHLPPAVTPGFSLRQTIALILASKSGEVCVVDDSDQRRPIVTVSATRLLKLLCPPLPAAAIASMASPQPHTTPSSRRGACASPRRADLAPPFQL